MDLINSPENLYSNDLSNLLSLNDDLLNKFLNLIRNKRGGIIYFNCSFLPSLI